MIIQTSFKSLIQISQFFMLLLLTVAPLTAQNATLYYDAKWQPTVKDSASYFRPPVEAKGNLFLVEDYFISGKIQMRGISKSATKDIWQGKVTWFKEDGSIQQQGNYVDNRVEGEYISFLNGKKLVATYKNGYFDIGEANFDFSSSQQYYKKTKDSVIEVFYDKDIKDIRYERYGTKDKPAQLVKYYDIKGKFIGNRETLDNGYFKGVEVFYSYAPMRVRSIGYYPYGKLLGSDVYYDNGKPREKIDKKPIWSKTYFSLDGKEIGKIEYQFEQERLKPYNGTVIGFDYVGGGKLSAIVVTSVNYEEGAISQEDSFYKNGQLKSRTTYANGTRELQVSYDETGKELYQMEYKNYYPFDGTEILKDKKTVYKSGELVSETTYYPKTTLIKSEKTKTKETFFDKDGKLLGELELEYKNNYSTPTNGQRFTMDYKDGTVASIEILKNGKVVNRTDFRKRLVGKETYKTYKKITEYDDKGYNATRKLSFYSNGKLQADVSFDDYKETLGKYFDENGAPLGSYDFKKENGTFYEFFSDSDEVKRMEEKENGVLLKSKRYDYGTTSEYGEINPVLIEDVDVTCCGTYYNREGKQIAKFTFKDKKPWEGEYYDATTRTLYTLKMGVREGTYKKLDYNLRVLEEGQYAANKKEGLFVTYDYQGKPTKKENFVADKLDGVTRYYNDSGEEIGQMVYKNGQPKDGKIILSNIRGKLTYEIYKNGLITEKALQGKDGRTLIRYAEDGKSTATKYAQDSDKKAVQYTSNDGYIDGKVERYDEKGKELYVAQFTKGKLVSGTVLLDGYDAGYDVKYVKVTIKDKKIFMSYYDKLDMEVFTAEEDITATGTSVYLKKMNLYLDYVRADKLY